MTALAAGLCSVTFRALPFGGVLALAHEAGIAGIEWGADPHAPPGDLQRARAIAEVSRTAGIAVASYGSYAEAGASSLDAFARVLETAVALGAPNVRVWAGRRGVPSSSVTEDERARSARDLHAFAAAASAANVSVSLEFHRETLTDSLDSTLDLLALADHPNLFTYWQPRPGIDAAEAAAEIDALHGKLSHLHVFHWNALRERFPLAGAAAFWEPLLERAARIGESRFPHRWAMIEFVRNDDPAAFAADARALRNWIAAASLAPESPVPTPTPASPGSERIA
jgi:sugar phosphate isomerase/epimerase